MISRNLIEETILLRRELHKIPEVSGKEYKTSEFIKNYLNKNDINFKEILETGIVAFIEGESKDIIGFRADMDALPIKEENSFDYVSTHEGVMHACGHDFHMSILMGFAKYIKQHKMKKSCLFIFQPMEEKYGGAKKMLDNDVWKLFGKPKKIFGFHINPAMNVGDIKACPNSAWAGAMEIELDFNGVGGHGAYPHKAPDLVSLFSSWYLDMQNYIARRTSAHIPKILTCGKIKGADTANIIPSKLTAGFTFRYFDSKDGDDIKNTALKMASNRSDEFGATFGYKIITDYKPVINSKKIFDQIYSNIKNSKYLIDYTDQVLIGEDVSFFINDIKDGVFFFLGTADGESYDLHTPTLNPSEKAIEIGLLFYVDLINYYSDN